MSTFYPASTVRLSASQWTHKAFAKSIALTPFAPKAGPTGGCADALPAGTRSLTSWATPCGPFFDIFCSGSEEC